MAATDFHEPFWLAIAAAAPIIGLASSVTAEQTVRRSESDIGLASPEVAGTLPIPNVTYWICYTNILLQAVALTFALWCLGTMRDHLAWGRQIAGVMVVLGMGLVLAPAVWTTTRIYRPAVAARKQARRKAGRAGGDGDPSRPPDNPPQTS
jgi:hypothetical protein